MTGRPAKQKVRRAKRALYRRLVLDGAERVFARKGYEDAKMEEIAREAGISLGTLYGVFRGKAEIFRAVHESADEELLGRAVACARGVEGPLEAVLAGVRAYTEYFLEHPDFLRMHLHEGFSWGAEEAGAGSRQRTEAWRSGVEMLGTAFARCIDEEIFVSGNPVVFARMMVAMQQVQLAHWIESGMERAPEEIVREMTEQVKRSFCRSGA